MATPLRLPTGKTAKFAAASLTVAASLPFLASVALAQNLLQYSEELEKWTMVRGIRVSANSTAAPDGTKTAETLADSLTLNSARISSNTVNAAQAGPYTFSIYLKAGTLTQAIICTRNGATGDHSGLKSVTLTPSWQRFSVTTASLKAGAPITAEVHPGVYDRDNGDIYAWGAQLEPGTAPTTYEKTTIGLPPVLDTTPPAAPSGLSASATTGVQLNWIANKETDLAGYKVYRAAAGSSTYAVIGTPTTPTFADSGVSAGKSYAYRVTAVDKAGNESPASATVSTTVPIPDTTPPAVPTSLKAQAGQSVTLTWAASTVSDFAGYKVFRAPAGSSSYAQIAAPTSPMLVDSSVTPGLAYSYQVSAQDKAGNESARSAAASATIPVDAPTGLTAAVANGKVELKWTAPAGSLSGYRVERATGTSTTFAQIAAPTSPAHLDGTVAEGTSYTYRVFAVGTAGSVSPASATATADLPDVTPPATPAGLAAAAGKTVQLTWTANKEADLAGYKVYRALSAGTFGDLANAASPAHTDSTVTSGLAYGYRVTALDKSGNESAPSAVASATIPVDAPSGVTAALVSGKIEVKWTAPAGSLSGYRVERGVNSTSSFAQLATPSSTSHLDTNVTAGNSYSYRVFAIGTVGNASPASAVATVSVPLPEPPPSTGENPNLIHYSEELEKWTPIRTPTVAPNATPAPDGQSTADRLTDNSGVDGARIDANTITSVGSAYTYSIFLKAGTLNTAVLCVRDGPNGGHSAFKIVTLTSEWARYSVTTPVIAAGKPMTPEVHAGKYDRDNGYIFVWGAQYEKGTSATTYKKTPVTEAPTADTTAPAVPAGLRATPAATSVALAWTANSESDLAGYRVYRATTQSGTYTQIGNPTSASLTDTNVTAGSTYWYKIAAVDDSGNASAQSAAVSAAVPQLVVTVPVPTGLTATLANNEVTVKWNALTGISSFRLERGTNSTSSFSSLASPSGTTHVDAGVAGGNSYSYRLCAVDLLGNVSAATSPVTVSVPLPEPTAPAGTLNVVSFGANPARAGDDRAAIQAALTAAVAQNKDLYFPAGYYWISGRVTFLKASGRTLFGDGMTASIIAGDTNKDSLLELQRVTNVTVRDLRFEGSLVNAQNTNVWPAIEPYLSTGTTIRKVHSYGTGYLVRDNSATGTTVEECVCEDYGRIGYLNGVGATLRNCKFICRPSWVFGDQMNGIYSSAGKSNVLVEGNQFIHCGSYAVTLWGSNSGVFTENFLIQNNYFERCDRALVIACSDSGPNYRNVKFLNNTIKQCADKSIHIGKFNGSNADGTALVIDGNVFEDPGSDMAIFMTNWNASGPIRGVRITNNEFRQPTKSAYYGIYLWQNVAPFSDVIVENNVMSDIGHNGTTEKAHCGIYLRSGTVTIRNNTLSHWANAGSSLTVDGLRVDSGAASCVITANTFNGNGKSGCYGLRMTGSGSSANGSVTNNLFRSAKLSTNGIPSSGNTVQ